jgi:hypothetical protein
VGVVYSRDMVKVQEQQRVVLMALNIVSDDLQLHGFLCRFLGDQTSYSFQPVLDPGFIEILQDGRFRPSPAESKSYARTRWYGGDKSRLMNSAITLGFIQCCRSSSDASVRWVVSHRICLQRLYLYDKSSAPSTAPISYDNLCTVHSVHLVRQPSHRPQRPSRTTISAPFDSATLNRLGSIVVSHTYGLPIYI